MSGSKFRKIHTKLIEYGKNENSAMKMETALTKASYMIMALYFNSQ